MYNPFQILGIPENSNINTVKKAYRKAARIYHPDVNPNTPADKFIEATEAYEYILKLRSQKNNFRKTPSEDFYKRKEAFYKQWVAQNQARVKQEAEKHSQSNWGKFTESAIYHSSATVNILANILFVIVGLVIIIAPISTEFSKNPNATNPAERPAYFTAILMMILGCSFIYGLYYFLIKLPSEKD